MSGLRTLNASLQDELVVSIIPNLTVLRNNQLFYQFYYNKTVTRLFYVEAYPDPDFAPGGTDLTPDVIGAGTGGGDTIGSGTGAGDEIGAGISGAGAGTGFWEYDPTDTTSPDNGTTTVVDLAGHRYKLQLQDTVPIPQYAIYGMSPSAEDNSAAALAALNAGIPIDLGGQTFKFLEGVTATNLVGRAGFFNGTLDFTNAVDAEWCLGMFGPGLIGSSATLLAVDAMHTMTTIQVPDGTPFAALPLFTEVFISARGLWCSAVESLMRTERNWIVSVSGNTLTLLCGLMCDYLVANDATVQAIDGRFQPYLQNLTVLGPGTAATAIDQTNIAVYWATKGYFNGIISENSYDIAFLLAHSSMCFGDNIETRNVQEADGVRDDYGVVVAAGRFNHFGSIIGRYCRSVFAASSTSNIISRNTIVDSVQAFGQWENIVNTHPGTADFHCGIAAGIPNNQNLHDPGGFSGVAVTMNGYMCSIGVIKAPLCVALCSLQDEGQRDPGRGARFWVGRIEGNATHLTEPAILIQGLADSIGLAGANFRIDSIDMTCGRGLVIEANVGNVGTVSIGPSVINASATGVGAVSVSWSGGFSLGRAILDHMNVTADPTAPFLFQSAGPSANPDTVVELLNPVATGGVLGIQITNSVMIVNNAQLAGYSGARTSVDSVSLLIEDGLVTHTVALTSATLNLPTIAAGHSANYANPKIYRLTVTNGGASTIHTIVGGVIAGQIVYLSGAGIRITNGADNIFTATGADVTMTGGLVFAFMYDGTANWNGIG